MIPINNTPGWIKVKVKSRRVKVKSKESKSILSKEFHIWPAFRLVRRLAQTFKKPNDRPTIDQVQGIIYKVNCHDCACNYVGESKCL